MQLRSLIIVMALLMVAGAAFAQDAQTTQNQTICVPASAGTTPAACSADAEQFNRNFLTSYFNVCDADITSLRSKYDWCTVYFIANIASKTGRPVSEIAGLVDQGMSMNDIACRYNLTVADLRQPMPCPTSVAMNIGPVGAGPGMMPTQRMGSWISDAYGNVVLTEREDRRLKKLGYTWQDIAAASNISMVTGVPVYEVLQWTDRGLTWSQIAREYGIGLCDANILDISCYPFQRDNTLAAPTCPVGAGPCPEPQPCPAPAETCPSPAPADLSCPPTPASTCPPAEPANPCPPAVQPCPEPCPPATQQTCPPAGSPNTPSTY